MPSKAAARRMKQMNKHQHRIKMLQSYLPSGAMVQNITRRHLTVATDLKTRSRYTTKEYTAVIRIYKEAGGLIVWHDYTIKATEGAFPYEEIAVKARVFM